MLTRVKSNIFWQEQFTGGTVYLLLYHAERHLTSGCFTISDVNEDFDHLVQVVTARFLHCKGHSPRSPWLNNLICQHETLKGQYLPLDGTISFQQIWLQGKIVQSKMVSLPIALLPKMGASYHKKCVLTVIEHF